MNGFEKQSFDFKAAHAHEVYKATEHLTKIKVPCGKCINCQKRKRDEWVFRLTQEKDDNRSSFFITLTYDEDNVPLNDYGIRSVSKSDVQKFIKRLRHKYNFRYFIISEYGPNGTHRPHYHAIFFMDIGSDIDTLLKFESDVWDTWHNGKVEVTEVCPEKIGYVANYCMKDMQPRPKDSEPNFMLSSRRPAIGLCYLTPSTFNYHINNVNSNIGVTYENRHFSLPRYYRDKIFGVDDRSKMFHQYMNEADKWHQEQVDFYGSEQAYRQALEGLEIMEKEKILQKIKKKQL